DRRRRSVEDGERGLALGAVAGGVGRGERDRVGTDADGGAGSRALADGHGAAIVGRVNAAREVRHGSLAIGVGFGLLVGGASRDRRILGVAYGDLLLASGPACPARGVEAQGERTGPGGADGNGRAGDVAD